METVLKAVITSLKLFWIAITTTLRVMVTTSAVGFYKCGRQVLLLSLPLVPAFVARLRSYVYQPCINHPSYLVHLMSGFPGH